MKHLLFKSSLIIPVLALTGCVETLEENTVPSMREVTFQVASYPTSRATGQTHKGTEFAYDHFVTHAWSDASTEEDNVFMNHEKVMKDETEKVWKPTQTYYWPTYSTVDFISYHPEQTEMKNVWPKVEREALTYTGYDVSGEKADITTNANDLMYADKAIGYGTNIDDVNDDLGGEGDRGYTGVPTLFNHALAQLDIRVLVQQPENETESHWEAVIEHAALTGYYTKGDLKLTLNATNQTQGVVGWTPVGDSKVGWTLSEDATKATSTIADKDITTDDIIINSIGEGTDNGYQEKGCKSIFKAFVLPQTLTGEHLFDLKFTLNKYRGETQETSEADTDIRHIQLKTSEIPCWGMNQRIVYTIVINPTKNSKVRFDPAIKEWQDVTDEKDSDDTKKDYIQIPGEKEWAESNVWYAYNEAGEKVAEMSKELIRDQDKNYYQAVIVNPILANGKADLKNGFIAQVLKSSAGSPDNLAGGSISYLSCNEYNALSASDKKLPNLKLGGLRSTELGNQANFTYCKVENGKVG